MNKTVIIIGAVSQDSVYGIGDSIPWRIREEMKHFKEQTTGHTVIMGRSTWESLSPKYRPLPGRANMVITNTPDYKADGAQIFGSIEQAIDTANTEKVFLIGGREIWYRAMPLADEALITEVRKDFWENQNDVRLAPELLEPPRRYGLRWVSSVDGGHSEIPFTIHRWVRNGRY